MARPSKVAWYKNHTILSWIIVGGATLLALLVMALSYVTSFNISLTASARPVVINEGGQELNCTTKQGGVYVVNRNGKPTSQVIQAVKQKISAGVYAGCSSVKNIQPPLKKGQDFPPITCNATSCWASIKTYQCCNPISTPTPSPVITNHFGKSCVIYPQCVGSPVSAQGALGQCGDYTGARNQLDGCFQQQKDTCWNTLRGDYYAGTIDYIKKSTGLFSCTVSAQTVTSPLLKANQCCTYPGNPNLPGSSKRS